MLQFESVKLEESQKKQRNILLRYFVFHSVFNVFSLLEDGVVNALQVVKFVILLFEAIERAVGFSIHKEKEFNCAFVLSELNPLGEIFNALNVNQMIALLEGLSNVFLIRRTI